MKGLREVDIRERGRWISERERERGKERGRERGRERERERKRERIYKK